MGHEVAGGVRNGKGPGVTPPGSFLMGPGRLPGEYLRGQKVIGVVDARRTALCWGGTGGTRFAEFWGQSVWQMVLK